MYKALGNAFLTVVAFLAPANATEVKYQTQYELASWNFSGDKFACNLNHEVENFGTFSLLKNAGEPMRLTLKADWLLGDDIRAAIGIEPSAWNRESQQALYQARWNNTYASLSRSTEGFLESLELGHQWRAELSRGDQHWLVQSSSVGAQQAALSMRKCLRQILPMSYAQLQRINISYASGSIAPNSESKQILSAAALYVAADDRISKVLVDGHTDSDGDSLENLVLSRTRADEVAARLVSLGIAPSLIEVRGHGERYPLVSNGSSKGRAKNRRVTIRLVMSGSEATGAMEQLEATLPKSINAQVNLDE